LISKKISGGYTPGLLKKRRGRRGEEEEREEAREGRPPIHIPGYATGILYYHLTASFPGQPG